MEFDFKSNINATSGKVSKLSIFSSTQLAGSSRFQGSELSVIDYRWQKITKKIIANLRRLDSSYNTRDTLHSIPRFSLFLEILIDFSS